MTAVLHGRLNLQRLLNDLATTSFTTPLIALAA
jgi:hypothetical protein